MMAMIFMAPPHWSHLRMFLVHLPEHAALLPFGRHAADAHAVDHGLAGVWQVEAPLPVPGFAPIGVTHEGRKRLGEKLRAKGNSGQVAWKGNEVAAATAHLLADMLTNLI